MKEKQQIYKSTTRADFESRNIIITEKIDGANLGLFKHKNELYIAQRQYIFKFNDITNSKDQKLYSGLYNWLNDHKKELLDQLCEGSIIFGEWIGMSQYKNLYSYKLYLFAKARIVKTTNGDFELTNEGKLKLENMKYIELNYAFKDQKVLDFISLVPQIGEFNKYQLNKDFLDQLYENEKNKREYPLEGFILYNKQFNNIEKYVRKKNSRETEHISDTEWEYKIRTLIKKHKRSKINFEEMENEYKSKIEKAPLLEKYDIRQEYLNALENSLLKNKK